MTEKYNIQIDYKLLNTDKIEKIEPNFSLLVAASPLSFYIFGRVLGVLFLI